MKLSETRFLSRLDGCNRILIAGAGGWFDVYSGLPLFFHLREQGKHVFLGNLSFTSLAEVGGRRITPHLVQVDASSPGPRYFPEGALARWLALRGMPTAIHCFDRVGCRPLAEAYRALAAELALDAVVLVDGGTDILMRGDEAGLGTPEEDLCSVAAVDQVEVREKLVVCLGFGVDRHHGVCHAQYLQAVSELARCGAYLGVQALLPEMPDVAAFLEAVRFANEQMPAFQSIVANSVASAVEGEYGDVHRTPRTVGARLWINPLMSLYWGFDLRAVAQRCLYLSHLRPTVTRGEVAAVIEGFREKAAVRPWEGIPV
jgi:hypothetical protein